MRALIAFVAWLVLANACFGQAAAQLPENIYAKMRRVITAARYSNPRTAGLTASPPTITVVNGSSGVAATPPAGLTNIFAIDSTKGGVFTPFGGPAITTHQGGFTTNYSNILTNTVPGPGYSTWNFRWSMMVDSAKFAIRIYGVSTPVRILVNGQYVSLAGVTPTTNDAYIVVDFTSAGGRANRKIEFESGGNIGFGFYSVSVGPTEGVSKVASSPMRVIFLGDSYFADVAVTSLNDGLPPVMGDYMGMEDEWTEGQGATGFLTQGPTWNFISHVNDITANKPDVIIVGSAANDQFAYTPAQITAAVTAFIAAVRAGPTTKNTPMFMLGAWPNQFGVTATNTAADAAVGAAVAAANAAGDTNVFYIPCVADPNGPWLTGTGNTSNPKGDGNLDVYGYPDGSHLNAAGWNFAAQRFTDQILIAIQGLPTYQGIR